MSGRLIIVKKYFNEYNPIFVLVLSLTASISCSIATNFSTRVASMAGGEGGLFMTIIGFLIIPIFVKEQRKMFWTKKGILIMLISIIINLPFAIISIKNKGRFF